MDRPKNAQRRAKVWFLNGEIVYVYHMSRAQGIVTLYNKTRSVRQQTTVQEWTRKRRRAYTVMKTSELLNYHRKSLSRLARLEIIPMPTPESGIRAMGHYAYYSEDDVIEIRKILAGIHHGNARKDGLVTNNKIPTEQELKHRMGDGQILYLKNDEGKFVPVFSETI